MNDKWQDELRNRMNFHEEEAPEGLWKGLEQRLISENMLFETDIISATNKKRRLLIISINAVVAAIVLLFFILKISDSNKINETLINDNIITSELADNNVSEIIESVKSDIEIKANSKLNSSDFKDIEEFPQVSFTTENVSNSDMSKEQTSKDEALKENNSNNDVLKEDLYENLNYESSNQLFASSIVKDNHKQSRWQTSVSITNTPNNSKEAYVGYGTFVREEIVDQQYAFKSKHMLGATYTDVKHEQPIILELSLRYNLSDRWSLASGLTYSMLSSKLRSESMDYFQADTQTLHYLGVPLNVGYTFWHNSKISSYILAGGLVEKNIAGKLTTNYSINNKLDFTKKESITSKQLQWSVNSAIGIEYHISNFLGIYAEPGMVYYFNNGSNLETIYKDRPMNFNLRLGFRFNINE